MNKTWMLLTSMLASALLLGGCRMMDAPRYLSEEEEATYHLLYAEKMISACPLEQQYRTQLNELVGAAIAAGEVLAPIASIPRIETLVDANVERSLQKKTWACAEVAAWIKVAHSEVAATHKKDDAQ